MKRKRIGPSPKPLMLPRTLEPEVMDTPAEALAYDQMDHAEVNRAFVNDFLEDSPPQGEVLDLGAGTGQIPIELCSRGDVYRVLAVDLSASMLDVAKVKIALAEYAQLIKLDLVDAKRLPYADGRFAAVMSNSIVHHVPHPEQVLAEAWRVLAAGGLAFFRDLLRPADDAAVAHLVETYAAGANAHQRQLFADSLRAALTLEEVKVLLDGLGLDAHSARQTSDRHWTWSQRKKPGS